MYIYFVCIRNRFTYTLHVYACIRIMSKHAFERIHIMSKHAFERIHTYSAQVYTYAYILTASSPPSLCPVLSIVSCTYFLYMYVHVYWRNIYICMYVHVQCTSVLICGYRTASMHTLP